MHSVQNRAPSRALLRLTPVVLFYPFRAPFPPRRMYLKFVEAIYLECLKERMMSDIKFGAVAR